jgi:transcriptional regulator with XRE-family HTH domain
MTAERRTSTASRALGTAISSARKHNGHTPESLAGRAGVDAMDYESIERGEADPSLDVIVQIASALGLTVSELFKRARL